MTMLLKVKSNLLTKSQLRQVLAILRQGGVIVYPTDTSYGIGCDATNAKAVKKVFAVKQRPAEKQVSVMVSGISMAQRYSQWNNQAQNLAQKWWPGPLTIILKKKKGRGTIGMRAPKHALALQIVKAYNKPIVTTSANISGQPPSYSIPAFMRQLKLFSNTYSPDFIIDAGVLPRRKPSTVIIVNRLQIKVLRQGTVHTRKVYSPEKII